MVAASQAYLFFFNRIQISHYAVKAILDPDELDLVNESEKLRKENVQMLIESLHFFKKGNM